MWTISDKLFLKLMEINKWIIIIIIIIIIIVIININNNNN